MGYLCLYEAASQNSLVRDSTVNNSSQIQGLQYHTHLQTAKKDFKQHINHWEISIHPSNFNLQIRQMFRESGHISERLVEVKKGLFGTFISGLILTGYSLNTDHANIDEAEVEV